MLYLTSLPDQVVEIGAGDALGVMFVASITFAVEGFQLLTLVYVGEVLGLFIFPVSLLWLNSCGLISY